MTDAFDLSMPLSEGLLVLEASAGTGKTWSLEALTVRAIAERGLRASQVCIVSFTRLATADLRSRVRQRLSSTATFLDSDRTDSDDPLHELLIDGIDADTRVKRARAVRLALAEFDSASITTIHGFCTRVLASGGADPSLPISEDDDDVVELVDDALIAEIAAHRDVPGWKLPARAELLKAVRLRLRLPDARIHTIGRGADDTWVDLDGAPLKLNAGQVDLALAIERFVELVERLVAEVHERRRARRIRTNDSLLTDARDLLQSPKGPGVVAGLRSTFALVLIDEFQDTDRVQWDIFRTAFLDQIDGVDAERPIVIVVGDPKQSIYRFRSAELSAYLDARAVADATSSVRTLAVNHRSDPALLDALEVLFDGFTFGDDEIVFSHVEPRPGAPRRAIDCHDGLSIQFRDLSDADDPLAWAVDDCVAEVVRLLTGAHIEIGGVKRAVEPRHIGILVRGNADADRIATALERAGVPASSSSGASVLESEAAMQMHRFLLALERPASVGRLRAAALGWFVGDDLHSLDERDDDAVGELAERFRSWGINLSTGGLPALMASVRADGLAARLLSAPQGDRNLTDLDHIVELLQGATHGARLTPTALLEAFEGLADSTGEGDDAIASELLARRVDRDEQTVTVVTIHKSKGLEFPIVLCPTLYKNRANRKGLHHAELSVRGERQRTISSATLVKKTTAKAFDVVDSADMQEYVSEDRRLLYVALTRAKHRLVVWWKPDTNRAALRELLDHTLGDQSLDALSTRSNGTIGVERVHDRPSPATWTAPEVEHGPLEVAVAERRFDRRWRVWSFSFIKSEAERLAEATAPVDLPEHSAGMDEPAADPDLSTVVEALGPLQDAPRGTTFGTLVHALFERLDFASDELEAELRDACAVALQYRRLPITPDRLAAGLSEAIHAPLGGPLGATRLRDLAKADRLDELSFDLPLGAFSAATIAEVLLRHLPADDPMRPWAEQAATELDVDVQGMLTGSIDLVARTTVNGELGYWLADHKTNHLASGDYSTPALADAMAHSGYVLQATIYSVALHRYLRWRVEGYDPERHLLGTAYLFLRGMRPDNDVTAHDGVMWWRVPTPALLELDALFAGGDA